MRIWRAWSGAPGRTVSTPCGCGGRGWTPATARAWWTPTGRMSRSGPPSGGWPASARARSAQTCPTCVDGSGGCWRRGGEATTPPPWSARPPWGPRTAPGWAAPTRSASCTRPWTGRAASSPPRSTCGSCPGCGPASRALCASGTCAPTTTPGAETLTLPASTARLLDTARAGRHEGALLLNPRTSRPWTKSAERGRFQRLVAHAGVPPITPYGLRVTMITLALDAGFSERQVSAAARHASSAQTARYDRLRVHASQPVAPGLEDWIHASAAMGGDCACAGTSAS